MLDPDQVAPRSAAADQHQPDQQSNRLPHSFDQAVFDEVCERLETGEDLTSICNSDVERFPHRATILGWAEKHPELGRRIAHARASGFDEIARKARQIARGDKAAGSTGDVARDRLIVETDLKLLAKWDPKRYGDLLKLGGPGGEALAPPVINQFIVQPVIAIERPADDDAQQLPALPHAGG